MGAAFGVLCLIRHCQHPALLPCLRGSALCAKKRGQYTEASRLLLHCLRVVEPDHPLRAKLMGDLADAQRKLEDYHCANDTYKAALKLLEATVGLAVMEAGELYHGIALVQKKLGSYEEAETAERSALAIVERLQGKTHYKVGWAFPRARVCVSCVRVCVRARRTNRNGCFCCSMASG